MAKGKATGKTAEINGAIAKCEPSPIFDEMFVQEFSSAETAGLAVESIYRSVIKHDKTPPFIIDKINAVVPQMTRKNTGGERGSRVDVDASADGGKKVIFELQLDPDGHIFLRNLFAAAGIITQMSDEGDTSDEMAKKMPHMVFIDIMRYVKHKGNGTDFIQPVKILYANDPDAVAISNFTIYAVQLPMLDKIEPQWDDDAYCFFYALHTADKLGKSLKEVMDMHPQLAEYGKRDRGFQQFCSQYGKAAADAKSRDDYYRWYAEQMRQSGVRLAAIEERDEYWLRVVEAKDAALEESRDALAESRDALADKDALLAAQAAEIARLTADRSGIKTN